jgi:short-subunit dehydrogenase
VTERVTLITGASAGIGTELARVFAANGHRLALTARRADRLEALANELSAKGGKKPIVIACDLQEDDAGEKIAAALASEGVELDHLVNNAGFGAFGDAIECDRVAQLGIVDVNVRALTDLSLRFADQLIKNKGGLLNVGSVAGFLPGPGMAVYYASKAFVNSFTEALGYELRRTRVTATVSCPGATATEFGKVSGNDRSKLFRAGAMSAPVVARHAYRAMMAGRSTAIPGALNRFIVFGQRFVPRALVRAIAAKLNRT